MIEMIVNKIGKKNKVCLVMNKIRDEAVGGGDE